MHILDILLSFSLHLGLCKCTVIIPAPHWVKSLSLSTFLREEVDTTNIRRSTALPMDQIALQFGCYKQRLYPQGKATYIQEYFSVNMLCQGIEKAFSTSVGRICGSLAVRFISILPVKREAKVNKKRPSIPANQALSAMPKLFPYRWISRPQHRTYLEK
ncbi:hypothetical protein BCR43DRAFT_486146 [Syncephalastrum racemosum]|uniref:Uncharacterized protein n=1 Tax=Syncephalastrum racemosum TaxID=13706 RepID=A0A1X2HPZ6_SYNRA|nr:hypothetical protein BCR43DRAFT_486146 [Syncephalastrum racemosum]